jgi:nickel transport system ATP-binding protein
MNLIEVENLSISNSITGELIVENLSFHIKKNTCLGIVGESGSGKSMSMKAILGLLPSSLKTTGCVRFGDIEMIAAKQETLRKIRSKHICLILQDAMTAFDPLSTMGEQIIETFCENMNYTWYEAKKTTLEVLKKMMIHDPLLIMQSYPHQLSGGMLQRCMIGLAMALKPEIIIADEPTTGLDSINQRNVLDEFKRLRGEGLTLIFISHDLGVIRYLADDVLVMRDGQCIEYGEAAQVFTNPNHSYSKYLIDTRKSLTKVFAELINKGAATSC